MSRPISQCQSGQEEALDDLGAIDAQIAKAQGVEALSYPS